ncbi:MAG: glyoxalase [Leifsonia sp.]|nr:glyoxalase [Leifsonia sp.]|tara:strand:+ start:31318 stop:31710 length:393 start_codon:yes stop_codon:yes gene_type:complete
MLTTTGAFSSFSVDDLDEALRFYRDRLGLTIVATPMGLELTLAGGGSVFIYDKGERHAAAGFTVLNLVVADMDSAVAELAAAGIELLRYPDFPGQGEDGVARSDSPDDGPTIAWISDPAGNVVGIIEERA